MRRPLFADNLSTILVEGATMLELALAIVAVLMVLKPSGEEVSRERSPGQEEEALRRG